ncbi:MULTISPECIES: hypothetical protein [unclassified Mycobacterium]|nr:MULTISPECIES: hypothetical protein [unclassified Mycobacterium]
MWVIEVNFAGYRFTHHAHDRRRPILRFSPRAHGWRSALMRRTPAA